ncbi:MAG: TonB-dependent receptor [Bacteroidota bacterium]|nr:TonB-dependent receptor [Flavisolibacter sp.]MBD0294690.1 TonB-dependent receptor [Flavisolibacter sp.]MBD0364492.1 TonB-dependent receptor [Flavisolibacter sp.]MDQ3844244.1 TonB-dependent receptor [Bacteroidota bacterium]
MKLLLLLFILLVAVTGSAQVTISGKVKDTKGTGIPGISVSLKDTYDGATTDSTGIFSFTTLEKGDQTLTASAIGYKAFEQKITLTGTALQTDITLKEEINEMKAVVITAGTFEASDRKRTTVLSSIDIVTTASANADVTGAIRTLPGAQQVGESEGLFVRGGTAAETKTFIDGTLVNNFFYSSVPNIAQRGRFSPFIFKGTVFSAGGYSALYGQALSSALILESIDLPDQSSASLSVSPIGGGVGFQKLSKAKNASWGINYGYTNIAAAYKLLNTKPEYFHIPEFHTADANFRIKTSKSGILKYYGYFSYNHLGVRNPSIDTIGYKDAFELRNHNLYHNLSWKENLGDHWKINTGVSYTNNRDNINGSLQNESNNNEVVVTGFEYKNFFLKTNGDYFNARAVLERRLGGLSAFRFGGEYNFSNDRLDYTLSNGTKYPNTIKEHLKAAFAEGDVYLTNDLAAKIGTRLEHSALLDKVNLAPRISLAYKLGKESQASLAYGIFYQNPERRYLPAPDELTFARATHYIAQYQRVSPQITFRAEVYYKKYNDLLKTTFVNNREVAATTSGSGYAKGFELFWRDRKTIKNFDYWISYSFLDTRRDFLNYPYRLEPSFAARHTANLVLKKFVSKLKTQFNANYAYATGRPYYNFRYDNNINKFSIADQGRTIDYNSLSFSVNYLPNVFKKGAANQFTVFVFSVTNVLGSKQVFGYNYSYNGLRKEAIVPPTNTFIYIGAFFSFGVDRSQEVINSNL